MANILICQAEQFFMNPLRALILPGHEDRRYLNSFARAWPQRMPDILHVESPPVRLEEVEIRVPRRRLITSRTALFL